MSKETTRPALSVITPMYNEAARIRDNIRQILETLDGADFSWEYILVDDGSTDDSLRFAQEALKGRSNCSAITYTPNRGRGYALSRGFAACRGEFVVTTESDLSWGPQIITRLYDALRSTGSDIVIASVNLPGGGLDNVPTSRVLLSRWGNWVMRKAFGHQLTMLSGMTRGYRGSVIKRIYLEDTRKEVHLEIVSKALALNYRITEIPARIKWEPERRDSGRGIGRGILSSVLPHITTSLHVGSAKLLVVASLLTTVIGALTTIVGVINKLFEIMAPKAFLIAYGLLLLLIGVFLGVFALLSIQLKFLYRSIVHLETEVKELIAEASRGEPE